MLNKVPEIAIVFWFVRILAIVAGATSAGDVAVNVGLATAVIAAVMGSRLAAALFLQMPARRYVAWVSWLTVGLVSILGIQITDALPDGLGGGLYTSTAAFAVTLAGRRLRDRIRGPGDVHGDGDRFSRGHRSDDRSGLMAKPTGTSIP
jgi:uncharacterized membrane-anchored protein